MPRNTKGTRHAPRQNTVGNATRNITAIKAACCCKPQCAVWSFGPSKQEFSPFTLANANKFDQYRCKLKRFASLIQPSFAAPHAKEMKRLSQLTLNSHNGQSNSWKEQNMYAAQLKKILPSQLANRLNLLWDTMRSTWTKTHTTRFEAKLWHASVVNKAPSANGYVQLVIARKRSTTAHCHCARFTETIRFELNYNLNKHDYNIVASALNSKTKRCDSCAGHVKSRCKLWANPQAVPIRYQTSTTVKVGHKPGEASMSKAGGRQELSWRNSVNVSSMCSNDQTFEQ